MLVVKKQNYSEGKNGTRDGIEPIQQLGRNNFDNAKSMAPSVEEQTTSLQSITAEIQQLTDDVIAVRKMIVEFKVI